MATANEIEAMKKEILSRKPEDITQEFLYANFSSSYDKKTHTRKKPKFNYTDECILQNNECCGNKGRMKTTLGRVIVNQIMFSTGLKDTVGYVNEPITKKNLGKIEGKIANALKEDRITTGDYAEYINKMQWLGFGMNATVCGSITPKTSTPLPAVVAERKKLIKEHQDELAKGDPVVMQKIEDKLLETAKKELKGDTGMSLFDSGAKASFGNNYKNMYVIRGSAYNNIEDGYDMIDYSYMEGLQPKNINAYANMVIDGGYPKAVGTRDGGYETKKFYIVYQDLVMDKKGSDCGSKMYMEVNLTSSNKNNWLYRYILEGSKLTLLTPSNIDKYVGKTVKMRSILYCCGDKLCNKCAGELYYQLGITSAGMTTSAVGSHLLNLLMKSFHDATVKITKIDIHDMMI